MIFKCIFLFITSKVKPVSIMDESINKLIFLSNCIYSIDFSEPSQKEEFDKIQDFQSIDDQTIARIKNQVEQNQEKYSWQHQQYGQFINIQELQFDLHSYDNLKNDGHDQTEVDQVKPSAANQYGNNLAHFTDIQFDDVINQE